MIWKSDTHLFTATLCQHTRKPCPALAHMAKALARGMSTSAPMTADDFELEGNVSLTHCKKGCNAVFCASRDRIRVFCDVAKDDDTDRLDRFADMLFNCDAMPVPTITQANRPCALLEAIPKPDMSRPAELAGVIA
ncbi:MAG: hypothetical protein ACR2O2_12185 [Ruegeria sp.]